MDPLEKVECHASQTMTRPISIDVSEVPPAKLQAIHIAIEASQEDWNAAEADLHLLRFASRLRFKFLVYLARTTTGASSAVSIPLSTNVHSSEVNPETRASTLSPFSGRNPAIPARLPQSPV